MQRRNELSKQVGAIKNKLKIGVKDEKVEQDIRTLSQIYLTKLELTHISLEDF